VNGEGCRVCDSFLYDLFKGARSAPHGLSAAYAEAPRKVGTLAGARRFDCPYPG
jgi:hypothetical protein